MICSGFSLFNFWVYFYFQKQRDPRLNEILFPEYDKKSVTKIIQAYESDQEYRTKSMHYYATLQKGKT